LKDIDFFYKGVQLHALFCLGGDNHQESGTGMKIPSQFSIRSVVIALVGQSKLIKKISNTVSWFLKHPVLSGVGSVVTIVSVLIPFFNQHNSGTVIPPPQPPQKDCIKNPIQVVSQNNKLNLPKSLNYLSGCYVDGCYTYQLKITDLVEIDISNQYLKGLDWHVGLSVSETKAAGRTHSTVIKIRSNGGSIDESRSKSTVKLDEKVHVWLDTLNICNREKRQ
jgi:hypothetical protein